MSVISALTVLFAFAADAQVDSPGGGGGGGGAVVSADSEATTGGGRMRREEDGGGGRAPLLIDDNRQSAGGVADGYIYDDGGAIGPIARSLGRNKRRKRNPVSWPPVGDGSPGGRDDGTESADFDGAEESCPQHSKRKNCFRDPNCEWVGRGKNGSCKAILRTMVQSRKPLYEMGEGVVCDFANPKAQSRDWIGLYDKTAEVDGEVPKVERTADWLMACGTKTCIEAPTSGAVSFPPLPDGSNGMYKCFLLRGDPRSGTTVVANGPRQQTKAANFPVIGRSSAFEVLTADSPASPAPSLAPSGSPSLLPSALPSSSPSASPSARPSGSPSTAPSGAPSAGPTASREPTARPNNGPTDYSSDAPSSSPSMTPTAQPSAVPTSALSGDPSTSPTAAPSGELSTSPTDAPSIEPSASLAASPSDSPSDGPSARPNPDPTQSTYVPGDLTVKENNLYLSTGLKSRIVASVDRRVKLTGLPRNPDGAYKWSDKAFHGDPDGGAVIEHPDGDGRYAYVSNVEKGTGGVGALYFDAEGGVIGYDMILTGTSDNCGGGLSPWPRKTWLTCEEHREGQVWEVDPWTKEWQETKMGKLPKSVDGDQGDKYEAVAYDPDTRDPQGKYRFFITTDSSDGQLIRWTPNDNAIANARETGNYWGVLSTQGTQEYLIVTPNFEGASTGSGTFKWSDDLEAGRRNAYDHFGYNEGIDINNGMLYFTCKYLKRLYILDLDEGKYTWSSTKSGAFDSQPDQVARIVGQDGMLYFCEDGGGSCGVHARDGSSGAYYTILEAAKYRPDNNPTDVYGTETTGLAFSPDKKKMIVSFQCCHIYEIWREDGLPFDGPVLNIKYHQEAGQLSIYQGSGTMPFSNALHEETVDGEGRIAKDSSRSAIKWRKRN